MIAVIGLFVFVTVRAFAIGSQAAKLERARDDLRHEAGGCLVGPEAVVAPFAVKKRAGFVDADGDGNPGVTTHVKVSDALQGDIYIARREIFAYDVLAQADASLRGQVSDHSEQLIVGATDDIFKTKAAWTQHPDLTKSPIILKRVGKGWDCNRLMAERDRLFPPTPTVDW